VVPRTRRVYVPFEEGALVLDRLSFIRQAVINVLGKLAPKLFQPVRRQSECLHR